MDPDGGAETQKAVSLQWKSYKLVQDPAIRRVTQKIYRYDGVHFSVPDSGFPPVGEMRDPRPRRLWSRYSEMSLPVPKFKLDEFYVGQIPLKEVTFARLNDNIKEPFLAEMCAKFGEVEEMEILFHPKTRKHLGLARVLFTSTRGAKDTVKQLHNTSVMGNIIHAQLDIKGQQRQKYYDLIVNGSYTPQTVPLGGKALTDRLQPQTPAQSQSQPQPDTSSEMRRRLSSELAVLAAGVQALTSGSGNITPCSADTGFGDQRVDTPPSSISGPYTPGSSTSSQGGGGTPYNSRSGTPFSQDSGYTGGRHAGYNTANMSSGYPPQDMLPSSSSSSAVSTTVGGYKISRYPEDAQDPSVYHRGRPIYPPTSSFRPNEPPGYPPYSSAGGSGPHMVHHSAMPPPPLANQYDQPQMSERERERDRDSGARYGAGGVSSRRSSYHHQQDTNSSSKYHSHHSHHHSERRDDRGYRRDSMGSRSGDHSHQRHRNHHHSHNHHGSSSSRRRSSHDRERDRDSDYSNSSDPRYNSNSYRSSSNSMSPPPSSYSTYSSKEPAPAPPQDASSRVGSAGAPDRSSLPSAGADKDFHPGHASALPPPPPPPPPPLPPASVIAAAVAETLGTLDFNQDSPAHEEQWTKPKRRPSTPPPPPKTPPPSSPPPHPSIAASSNSPSTVSVPHLLPSSNSPPPPQRDSSSPELDSTNESLPFVYHSSSLDSRIEMLLKEQKAKFSFLASDEEDEDDRKEVKQRVGSGDGMERKGGSVDGTGDRDKVGDNGEKDHRRKGERERDRGRKRGKVGEGRRSPNALTAATPTSSTYSPHIPPLEEPQPQVGVPGIGALQEELSLVVPADSRSRTGAHTPPYNGQSQASPHSSGEDMEISDEEEETATITTVSALQPSVTSGSSPSSSQAAPPSQAADPSSSPTPLSDSAQHFGTSMHPPIPSYPPHLPPPPPPAYSLQPPPPPGIPPLPHMELHPEYPPPMPHHMYDYATSMELMNQYSGGTPMSFQMQTHMLSRLHQLRMSSANGTPGPGEAATADYSSYHLHSMAQHHAHHPYMDQEGSGTGAHYDQDHRYMPQHMSYPYTDPHNTQIAPPPHHSIPPPHTGWPPHVLPSHYASYMPPPAYGTMLPGEGEEYSTPGQEMPMLPENPHEATVQMVLATLIQEMKNIMQRDLNRKMVENVAFATFDEWWDRKETKAKPFQTMVRGVSALRDEEKKEEKVSRPREPLTSLVDWAKSGGIENFSLRGALRLPSFKVKRKEPLELNEGDMKRPRPSTPPDEDAADGRLQEADRHGAQRDSKRRKKKPRSRKPWELDSEGEETSDGSSSEKEDEEEGESGKESDDDALSADSDDESLSSSSDGSSSSASSSSSSSSEDEEEEGERVESEGPDSMDESTMDSTTEKVDNRNDNEPTAPTAEVKTDGLNDVKPDTTASTKHPSSPPHPRPSSPVIIVPPLKKRRKTVSFSTDETENKSHHPTVPFSPSPSLVAEESPVSPIKPSDSPVPTTPAPSVRPTHGIQLLPFASKPGEGNALILPLPGRATDPEDSKKAPHVSLHTTPVKSPGKRGAGKDSPKSPVAPVKVCRTVQNLPLDHASMCRMAFEDAPPSATKRSRGRPRTSSVSASSIHSLREEDEDEEENEHRLRLREQLGASSLLQLASASTDLSVLAAVALKMDPEAGDSEETETSDEAEEQKMEEDLFSPGSLALSMSPGGVIVLMEHNYCKPPLPHAQPATKRTFSRQDSSVLLPADLNAISGVLEAPEEVIGEALPSRGDTGEYLSPVDVLCDSEDTGQLTVISPSTKKKNMIAKGFELDEKSKKRRRKDKENLEVRHTKKQKEKPDKKQKKRKLEDSEEDVDVEELESGELSSTDSEEEVVEEVRKSERLFLQEAGVTSSRSLSKPPTPPKLEPVKYDNRSEFEQMTILYDIWNSGLDGEDLMLLKKTYEKLLQDDHSSDWLNDTHWVNHTVTNLPNPRRKKKSPVGQLREHLTGSARSEGYYAISRKEKDVYLDLDLPEQVIREVENVDTTGANRALSERRSEQRRLLTVIGTTAVMDSDLLKLNQLKFRKKKLRFGRSRIHEWGLFAMEPIAADEMVIEYVGQNIRQMVADNREKRYTQQGIGSSYLFRVDHDTIIDATKCGNLARFINHCCTPNCYAKVITIESQKKIVIYSKQAIAVNEEITYDYKFPLEDNKIPCLCGTENCRGTLN